MKNIDDTASEKKPDATPGDDEDLFDDDFEETPEEDTTPSAPPAPVASPAPLAPQKHEDDLDEDEDEEDEDEDEDEDEEDEDQVSDDEDDDEEAFSDQKESATKAMGAAATAAAIKAAEPKPKKKALSLLLMGFIVFGVLSILGFFSIRHKSPEITSELERMIEEKTNPAMQPNASAQTPTPTPTNSRQASTNSADSTNSSQTPAAPMPPTQKPIEVQQQAQPTTAPQQSQDNKALPDFDVSKMPGGKNNMPVIDPQAVPNPTSAPAAPTIGHTMQAPLPAAPAPIHTPMPAPTLTPTPSPVMQQAMGQTNRNTLPQAAGMHDRTITSHPMMAEHAMAHDEAAATPAPAGVDLTPLERKLSEYQQLLKQLQASTDKNQDALQARIRKMESSLRNVADDMDALNRQVGQVNDQMGDIRKSVHAVSDKFSALSDGVDNPDSKEKTRAEGFAAPAYRMHAIIPGRAWLKRKDGSILTVIEGDMLDPYGKVLAIDPSAGAIVTSSGVTIR
ncbi:MAG: hypothetical protein V4490_03575 [Pseudomonadota bacterium]